MGRREQSYRMGKQKLVTHAVGHGFKSQLCKLQGLRKEKTDLRKAHREVTWSTEDGTCCGHASSCRPAGLGRLPEGDPSESGPGEQQVSERGHVSESQGTRLGKSYRMSPREEPQGGREGPFWQEARGGWVVLSSGSHETSLYGRWWVPCQTVHP